MYVLIISICTIISRVNLTLKTKKMKKLLQIVLVSSLSLLCFSCYYDEIIIDLPEIPEIPPGTEITLSNDVQPIFTQYCIGCHPSLSSPDLRSGKSYSSLVPDYVVAGDAVSSKLYQKLPGIGHPINTGFELSVDDISIIKAWIDQGAIDN